MTDTVRLLTGAGSAQFAAYITALKEDPTLPPPWTLLSDESTSEAAPFIAEVEKQPGGESFQNRFEFGKYLRDSLTGAPSVISHLPGLWNWLALYYFDQICPPDAEGKRDPFEIPTYVLESTFNFRRYYRHLVRTPWNMVALHGDLAKVVLMPLKKTDTPLAQRGELIEQFASRQHLISSRQVLEAATQLYFDASKGRPRGGGGAAGGSARRLASVLLQFDRTYDLGGTDGSAIVNRLPKEFDQWKAASPTQSATAPVASASAVVQQASN